MENFIADLKERFLKFDTLHGLYKIPLGIVLIAVSLLHIPYWQAIFELQYSIHDIALFIGVRALFEGLENLLINPVKKAVNTELLKIKHIKRNGITALRTTPPVTATAPIPSTDQPGNSNGATPSN